MIYLGTKYTSKVPDTWKFPICKAKIQTNDVAFSVLNDRINIVVWYRCEIPLFTLVNSYCLLIIILVSRGISDILFVVTADNFEFDDLIRGNMTAQRYAPETVKPHVFLLSQDAPPHTDRVTLEYFEQNNGSLLPWAPHKTIITGTPFFCVI